MATVASLTVKNDREQWENIFNKDYIQPVLQVAVHSMVPSSSASSLPPFALSISSSYISIALSLFLLFLPLLCYSPYLLKGLEKMLTKALDSILKDEKQGERVQNNIHGQTLLRWMAKTISGPLLHLLILNILMTAIVQLPS